MCKINTICIQRHGLLLHLVLTKPYFKHLDWFQVPRVFIGGKCVGGGSETYSLLNKGELVPLLKAAGATFKKTD